MKTIMIDDEPEVLLTYNEFLKELGYPEATMVSSSAQYKDKAEIDKLVAEYDLVICDVHMPHVLGNEILQHFVAARKASKKTPAFIVITGVPPSYFPQNESGWGSLAAADEILGKPVELYEFKLALKKLGFSPRSSA